MHQRQVRIGGAQLQIEDTRKQASAKGRSNLDVPTAERRSSQITTRNLVIVVTTAKGIIQRTSKLLGIAPERSSTNEGTIRNERAPA